MMERFLDMMRLYLPVARPYFPHATALLVFGVLGWLNGHLQASRPPSNPNLKENWAMPVWAPFQVGPERQTFSDLEIWDGKKAPDVKKTTVVQQAWQLVGTVRAGKTYTAIVQLGGEGRIMRMSTGDALPNGEKITAVGNGTLQIDTGGTQHEIRLFQSTDQQNKK